MGNRVVTFTDPSLGIPSKYKFGERVINAPDHGFQKVDSTTGTLTRGNFVWLTEARSLLMRTRSTHKLMLIDIVY